VNYAFRNFSQLFAVDVFADPDLVSIASFAYLVAILRRLTTYRAQVRTCSTPKNGIYAGLMSAMFMLVLIWAAGAVLADDNLRWYSICRKSFSRAGRRRPFGVEYLCASITPTS
jgi:hypothetical protein